MHATGAFVSSDTTMMAKSSNGVKLFANKYRFRCCFFRLDCSPADESMQLRLRETER